MSGAPAGPAFRLGNPAMGQQMDMGAGVVAVSEVDVLLSDYRAAASRYYHLSGTAMGAVGISLIFDAGDAMRQVWEAQRGGPAENLPAAVGRVLRGALLAGRSCLTGRRARSIGACPNGGTAKAARKAAGSKRRP